MIARGSPLDSSRAIALSREQHPRIGRARDVLSGDTRRNSYPLRHLIWSLIQCCTRRVLAGRTSRPHVSLAHKPESGVQVKEKCNLLHPRLVSKAVPRMDELSSNCSMNDSGLCDATTLARVSLVRSMSAEEKRLRAQAEAAAIAESTRQAKLALEIVATQTEIAAAREQKLQPQHRTVHGGLFTPASMQLY